MWWLLVLFQGSLPHYSCSPGWMYNALHEFVPIEYVLSCIFDYPWDVSATISPLHLTSRQSPSFVHSSPKSFMSIESWISKKIRRAKRTRVGKEGAVAKENVGPGCCEGRSGKSWMVLYLARGMLRERKGGLIKNTKDPWIIGKIHRGTFYFN